MHALWLDFKYELRCAWRRLGTTALLIAMLALGMGITTTVFSLVDATLLRSVPFAEADRLAELWQVFPDSPVQTPGQPLESLEVWRKQSQIFERVEGYAQYSPTLTERGAPEVLKSAYVTTGLFDMLGIVPLLGRNFSGEDGVPGNTPVCLISEPLWKDGLGSDPNVLNESLKLDGQSYRIIGVLPPWLQFPYGETRAWIPLSPSGGADQRPNLVMVGRIRPELTFETAQRLSEPVSADLDQQRPRRNGWKISLKPLQGRDVNDRTRAQLWMLSAAGLLVLLIACANAANLQLAQIEGRKKEIGIRLAVGGSRAAILRQFLVRSLMISLSAGGLGLLLTAWSLDLVVAMAPQSLTIFNFNPIRVDYRSFLFVFSLAGLSSFLFGLLPALRASSFDANRILHGLRQTFEGRRLHRLRSVLVTAEMAIALILLIGAGLLINTFWGLQRVDLGFDPEGLLVISLPRGNSAGDATAFYDQVMDRLENISGVQEVTRASGFPPGGGGIAFGFGVIESEESPQSDLDFDLMLPFAYVSPNYFRMMGIELLAGRSFEAGEARDSVIINQVLRDNLWGPDENPLGHRFRIGKEGKWLTVVGVAGNVKEMGLRDTYGRFQLYYPLSVRRSPTGEEGQHIVGSAASIAVRSSLPPPLLAERVRQIVTDLDPDQPIYDISTMQQKIAGTLRLEKFYLILLVSFAASALLLAALGIYAVISFLVSSRAHEIGIRIALGGRPGRIVALVVRQGVMPILAGALFGLLGAGLLTRFLSSLLFGVQPLDFSTFAIQTLVLIGSGVLASLGPARRASQADPLEVLRQE